MLGANPCRGSGRRRSSTSQEPGLHRDHLVGQRGRRAARRRCTRPRRPGSRVWPDSSRSRWQTACSGSTWDRRRGVHAAVAGRVRGPPGRQQRRQAAERPGEPEEAAAAVAFPASANASTSPAPTSWSWWSDDHEGDVVTADARPRLADAPSSAARPTARPRVRARAAMRAPRWRSAMCRTASTASRGTEARGVPGIRAARGRARRRGHSRIRRGATPSGRYRPPGQQRRHVRPDGTGHRQLGARGRDFHFVADVNYRGAYRAGRAAIPHLIKPGGRHHQHHHRPHPHWCDARSAIDSLPTRRDCRWSRDAAPAARRGQVSTSTTLSSGCSTA